MPGPHLSYALYFLLLGTPRCALAMPPCKEEEYPVGAQCCPKCSPGYRVKQACGELTGTLCAPCTPGTYTAHLNGLSECLQCRVCDPALGLVTRRQCSSTENTVCGCDQGWFCVMEDGGDCAECRPHRVCRPGQSVQQRGTEWEDMVCADCPPGTFSPNGTLAECQPWTKCNNQLYVNVSPGTSSTDATCTWNRLLLLTVIIPVILVPLCLLMKTKKLFGGPTKMTVFPQWKRQQTEGDATAVQTMQVTQVLPDVTTVAVEETASPFLERDQTADKCLQDADV